MDKSTWRVLLPVLVGVLFMLMCILSVPAWATDGSGIEESERSARAQSNSSEADSSSKSSLESNSANTVNARQTADNSFLYDTSIYELTQADATYQGDTVQIVGEVVGDSIAAEEDPGKYWITLEAIEEEYESSISVLVSKDILGLIDTYGGYNRKGTTLQVRGTFYLACPSHEGIMDIHADYVVLVARGSETSDEFHLHDFHWGFALVGFGLLLTLLYHYLRERER